MLAHRPVLRLGGSVQSGPLHRRSLLQRSTIQPGRALLQLNQAVASTQSFRLKKTRRTFFGTSSEHCLRGDIKCSAQGADGDSYFQDQSPHPTAAESTAAESRETVELPVMSDKVTAQDLEVMEDILTCASSDELVAKVQSIQQDGRLTEGLLEAFYTALGRAQDRNEPEGVIASLQGICQFLAGAYQQNNKPPALELTERILQVMNDAATEEEAANYALLALAEAFKEGSEMTCDSFLKDLTGYLVRMGDMDRETDTAYEQNKDQLNEQQQAQFEEMRTERAKAKEQLEGVFGLAQAYKTGVADGSIEVGQTSSEESS
mmetsp:Transcript_11743/g.13956  ORF Transcript_11743/g.13956 Transcript_11743/m.13956 type:complete len:319 (+) Transcript_11743:173-1129(+)